MKLIDSNTTVTTTVVNKYKTSVDGIVVVERIVNDNEPIYSIDGKGPHGTALVFVNPEFWEAIKVRNPWMDYYEGEELKYGWDGLCHDMGNLNLETIEYLINSRNYIFYYGNGHEMFDHEHKIIPYAKSYDYIGTVLNNGQSNLEDLLEYLKTHDWTVNKEDLKIEEIPYYNHHGGQTKYIPLTLLPPQEVYQEMYEKYSKDDDLWSTKMNSFLVSYMINEDFDPIGILPYLKENK
jgi:hypothetical protein